VYYVYWGIFDIFVVVVQQPWVAQTASLLRFIDHAQLDAHTPSGTPLNGLSARRRGRYLHNTQQTQQTKLHALSGIRNCDTSSQAAKDIRFRPQGHRDWCYILVLNIDTIMYLSDVRMKPVSNGTHSLRKPEFRSKSLAFRRPGVCRFGYVVILDVNSAYLVWKFYVQPVEPSPS
jgi:hypothetical protein